LIRQAAIRLLTIRWCFASLMSSENECHSAAQNEAKNFESLPFSRERAQTIWNGGVSWGSFSLLQTGRWIYLGSAGGDPRQAIRREHARD